ncbi:MAG: toll/interleukin-1 receptor domain-containing protein [Blastocatellia bacterium]
MAYLPGFSHDIFISYAHVDDQDGWVEVFQQKLELELSRFIGRMNLVSLWRDKRRLEGNHLFDTTIEAAIKGSALLVALTSRGYLASDYCLREIRWFGQKSQQEAWGRSIGDQLRISNVLIGNIHHLQWPEEVKGTSGHKFHNAERDDQVGFPIHSNGELFTERLRLLAVNICHTLEAFKSRIEIAAANGDGANRAEADFTVFLADASDSLRTVRRLVENDLRKCGVALAERVPPPYESAQHQSKAVEVIRRADLAVHLFDHLPGREIDGATDQTYPQLQAEIAIENAKAQLIWVPPSPQKIEDESHRQFLERLERGPRGNADYEFIRELPNDIAQVIAAKIEKIKSLRQPATAHDAALLDLHRKDQMHALDLGRALVERNVQLYINPEDDDPHSNLKILEERLKQVSRLIVLFGEVTEDWVRARLAEALKIAVDHRCPLKTLAVCFVPPRRKEDGVRFDLSFAKVHHFNFDELKQPQALTILLDEK